MRVLEGAAMSSRLVEKDWLCILDSIYHLNELRDRETFQRETLKYLRLSTPFCQGIFYAYNIVAGKVEHIGSPVVLGDKALYLDEFHRDYSHDSLFDRWLLATQCEVIRDTDVYPDEVRTQTDWYRNIYVKQGIHYALRVTLIYNRQAIGEIDLFRPKSDSDFSDTSMYTLGILAPHLAQKLFSFYAGDAGPSQLYDLPQEIAAEYSLTPREAEVIAAIANKVPDQEVADQLSISTSTLKKHIHNAYRKMRVSNRRELFATLNAHR